MSLSDYDYSDIMGVYEKHTQKDRLHVRGFAGVAVKNTRCLAAHAPNQSARGSEFKVGTKDLQEIDRDRGFS